MKISYAIPVCNEHEELKRLLEFLVQNIEKNDGINEIYDFNPKDIGKTMESMKSMI